MGRACSASRWLGQADACADVGAAKGIGHLVPAGHVPDEVGGVVRGIPAAVTYNGRAEAPRSTGTAWVAVRKADLATPITGTRVYPPIWTDGGFLVMGSLGPQISTLGAPRPPTHAEDSAIAPCDIAARRCAIARRDPVITAY